jgi:serine protease Do
MRTLMLVACASVSMAATAAAQERPREAERQREARTLVFESRASQNRAVLGITISSGGAGDSLGVLVAGVTDGSPAAQAGITEGMRIIRINDVPLRLAAEDARAGDMGNVISRRLQREMGRVNPGDEVRLQVMENGRTRDIRIRAVAASELPQATSRIMFPAMDPDRPVLGVSISGSASPRDTLGLFVMSVTSGGPAERAGVLEGHRIAEINGVNVRIPREDAGDPSVRSTMHARFTRELRNVRPGDTVRLRVWADGRYRDLQATPVRASELPSASGLEMLPLDRGVEVIRGQLLPEMRRLETELQRGVAGQRRTQII